MTDISAPMDGASTVRSPALKFLLIIGLSIAMAIPLFFIQLALWDREQTMAGATSDVATGWGREQVLAGPVLTIPYTVVREQLVDGKTVQSTVRQSAMLLPQDLKIHVRADTGTRWRGIFPVPVYNSQIAIDAAYDKASLAALFPSDATIIWKDATASIVVSDAHGLAENVTMSEGGQATNFQSGLGPNFSETSAPGDAKYSGIHVPVTLDGPRDIKLSTNVVLRGSRELSVSPLGGRTEATIESKWPNPSFFGAFLPSSRAVNQNGFTATWIVPYLARGFGQSFNDPDTALGTIVSPAFGVRFYQPVDYYQLVQRSLKYAILFVALAFLTFFVVETVSLQRLHAVQYTLVGIAQVLFYLLLLSLGEHIGFAWSYLTASIATVLLTGLYAVAALNSRGRAMVLTAILTMLYGLLYVILNAEDFALVIGAISLFAALAATMYATRRIDWYRLSGTA